MSRRAAFGGRLTGADTDSSSPSSTAPSSAPPASQRSTPGPARQNAPRTDNKGKGKGRAQGQPQGHQHGSRPVAPPGGGERVLEVNAIARAMAKAAEEAGETGDDEAICFICAEPVSYWSVSACNHRTCHTCSIRLRALYKKKECTFCKTDCPTVIFTESEEKLFEDYPPESTPFSDTKLGILFETRAQLEDTLSLLRFNCPYKPGLSDPSSAAPESEEQACDHILSGWSDLKRHVRATHHCTLCDLCCSNKKIFAHEHELFALANNQQGGGRGGRRDTELDQHLEKQHAMCGFCKRWFYDSDGLYKHCRENHEECFICVRQGIRHQYHLNYDRLEQHFKHDHFLCPHPDCMAQKFVVFESELDLQAHALEVHGVGSFQDQKARKEARRIETHFVYSTGESSASRGGAAAGARRQGQQGRTPAASFVEPSRGSGHDTPAHQQQQQPHGERRVPGLGAPAAGGSRAARFGGQLTGESSPSSSGATTPLGGDRSGAGASGADAATLERHAALLRRVQDLTHGHEGKLAGFKIAARGFRSGEMRAQDLVDQLYHVFDQRVDDAEAVILGFADLLDEPDKKRAVQIAWRDLRSENNFPSLAPLAPTLHGVPTAVQPSSQRALAAQHRSGGNPSSTWDRVERAATSAGPAPVAPRSNPFPALMSASNAKSIPGLSKAGQASKSRPAGGATAWSSAAGGSSSSSLAGPSAFPSLGGGSASSSRASSAAPTPRSISRPTSGAGAPRRAPSGMDFPSLQPSTAAADARARMRAALNKPAPRAPAPVPDEEMWPAAGGSGAGRDEEQAQAQRGKKGKGRQKVVLLSSGLASQTG